MIVKQKIQDIVENLLQDSDKFIVDIKLSSNNQIKIFIDADTKVTIEDCVLLSKEIESKLDREKEDFELQVSSAGIDKALKSIRQYKKNIGKDLKLSLQSGKEFKAELLEVSEHEIVVKHAYIQKQGKKKIKMEDEKHIPFEEIKTAKIVISF